MYKKFRKPAVIIITTIILSVTIFAIASASSMTMKEIFADVIQRNGEAPFERNGETIATEIQQRLGCEDVYISTERIYVLWEDKVMVYKFQTDFDTIKGSWWPTLYWANDSFMTIDVLMEDGTLTQVDAIWESFCIK